MRKLKLMAATSAVALLTAGSAYAADPVEKEGMNLVVYGWVNYVAMFGETGSNSGFFVANNRTSTSRFGFKSTGMINDDLKVGAWIEAGWGGASADGVTYNDPDAGLNGIWFRVADLWVQSASMGKVSLGHGYQAADGWSEVDLSGTALTALGMGTSSFIGNGLRVAGQNYVSGIEGATREDRVRYDSPSIGGLTLSTSVTTNGAVDFAARYARAIGDIKVAAQLGYVDWEDPNNANQHEVGGSIGLKHSSGLNLNLYYGESEADNGNDTESWMVKPGYSASLNEYGPTHFAVSYHETERDGVSGTAEEINVIVVQDISHLGASFYAGYKNSDSARGGDDVDVVWVGSRIKF